MKTRAVLLTLLLWLAVIGPVAAAQIGLCITATGRYDQFVPELVESARKHFCPAHKVTFFVFTDGTIPLANDIVCIEQKRLGWPYDTMMRMKIYYANRLALEEMDYLFAIDADMRFVGKVDEQILSKRVGTAHPGFVGKRGSYETDERSLAKVCENEGKTYFAGGFWGGSRLEFLKACKVISTRIDKDLESGIIPVWHDESHLNRYFIDFPPTKVLSPSYCYPEELELPYKKKILALCKNHSVLRQ